MIISSCEYYLLFSSCEIYIGDGIGYILNFCFFFIVGIFIARNLTRLHGMKLGTRVQERQITFCKQNIKELQYYIIMGVEYGLS